MPMPTLLDVTKDSSDSETEFSSKSTYRVSICLKRYFSDIRALSYVLISKKKTVKWLEKKVKKLFNVNEDFILTCRGHLLPSSERLGLLNADDVVEVVPNASHSNNKLKSAQAVINNGCNVESISIDEADSAVNKNQIYSSTITCDQKDSLKESEERTIIESDTGQNKIEYIQTVSNSSATVGFEVNVESDYESTDKCDSDTSAKKIKKNPTYEHEEPSKVIEVKKGVESDPSNGSNIHYVSTNEVEDQLEVMKRNALALLDSSINSCSDVFQNSRGTRKRKRVRRKRQQAFLAEEVAENNLKNDSFNNTLPEENIIKQKSSVTESSNTVPVVILRNEEISIRKPRLVQSIVESR